MRFVVFCEGETEYKVLPGFLKRWLDERLKKPIKITSVDCNNWSNMAKDLPVLVKTYLNNPVYKNDIVAVVAVMDLYGPDFYPHDVVSVSARYTWAKKHFESQVSEPKFRQHFAVHELEAWLLSDPNIFPATVKKALSSKVETPETVNFQEPPAKLLHRLYRDKAKIRYIKTAAGIELFAKLNPEVAYGKCPYLQRMLDEMLDLARNAGL